MKGCRHQALCRLKELWLINEASLLNTSRLSSPRPDPAPRAAAGRRSWCWPWTGRHWTPPRRRLSPPSALASHPQSAPLSTRSCQPLPELAHWLPRASCASLGLGLPLPAPTPCRRWTAVALKSRTCSLKLFSKLIIIMPHVFRLS